MSRLTLYLKGPEMKTAKTRYVYACELGRDGFRCIVGVSASLKTVKAIYNEKATELRNGTLFLSRWVDGQADNCADLESIRLPE